jgi:uncharacterized ferritin-like protein (DUF455 family)
VLEVPPTTGPAPPLGTGLRDFAQRILYGETLADKLFDPGQLHDEVRGSALSLAPLEPGRPAELRFRSATGAVRPKFPRGAAALADPEARGVVLHFFANHELLAMELMALALLRFPDAPAGFRMGVAHTLRDEQRHLQFYLDRMGELGVPFGAVPVTDFFWATLREMPDPATFAANLSLVFEQANLDFALQYAKAFHQAGDVATGLVLEQVLRDEVRHVAHGVRWLKHYADPADSLWNAWLKRLLPPLTPARAKGSEFDPEVRARAGIDADFVERLRVFVHSRGRAPAAWWFDPTVEDQARDARFAPTDNVRTVWADLAPLMGALAARDDVVLVPHVPDRAWLADLLAAGFNLPEFVQAPLGAATLPAKHPLLTRTLSGLMPWGDGPGPRRFAAGLAARLSDGGFAAPAEGLDLRAHLFGKPFAAGLRTDAHVCHTVEAVHAVLAELPGPVRIKAAFGTAGRGQVRVPAAAEGPRLLGTQPGWLARTLRQHRAVVVEPEYTRVADVSALFVVEADGTVRHRGVTRFVTDSHGTWRATCVGDPMAGLAPDLLRFFAGDGRMAHSVPSRMTAEADRVGAALFAAGHRGPAGIDGLVAAQPEGGFALVPLIEVNPRHTMGHVALRLARRVAPGSVGRLVVVRLPDLRVGGHADFEALVAALSARLPRVLRGTPSQLVQGVVALAEPARAQMALPLLVVGVGAEALAETCAAEGLLDLR